MFSIKVSVLEQDSTTQQSQTDITFTNTISNVTSKDCKLLTLADSGVATLGLQAGIKILVVDSTEDISVSVNGTVVSKGKIHVLSDTVDITTVVITNLTTDTTEVKFYGVNS